MEDKLEIKEGIVVHKLIYGVLDRLAKACVFTQESTLLQFFENLAELLVVREFCTFEDFTSPHSRLLCRQGIYYLNMYCGILLA